MTIACGNHAPADQGDDLNSTSNTSIEQRLFRGKPETLDKDREEIADTAIRNISSRTLECEGPRHRVGERFAELIPFEGWISNTLLVSGDAFNGKSPLRLRIEHSSGY